MAESGLIIAVCTGNICRSPMAEALLAHALKAETGRLAPFRVISAGVAARSGDPASANSVTALKKVGIDISQHLSQPLTTDMVAEADVVFGMTDSHLDVIQAAIDPSPQNIHLLRGFMPAGTEQQIADPYGGPLPLYEACRDEIVEAIPSVMAFLRKEFG
jgi:protein-tyrosine-phosphatase